jgi:hypothetical protein
LKITDGRKSQPILIWERWFPSLFESVLCFHAQYYVNISGLQKRHVL